MRPSVTFEPTLGELHACFGRYRFSWVKPSTAWREREERHPVAL